VCDLETSRIGAPYIYIYDISNLRVKRVSEGGNLQTWVQKCSLQILTTTQTRLTDVLVIILTPSRQMSGQYLNLGHDCFLLHLFRFII